MEEHLRLIEKNLDIIRDCDQALKILKDRPKNADIEEQAAIYRKEDIFRNRRRAAVDQLRIVFSNFNLGVRTYQYPDLSDQSSNRYLAFIDILGFSDIIANNDPFQLSDLMESLIGKIQYSLSYKSIHERAVTNDAYGRILPNLDNATVNSMLFSDTILMWTVDDSPESFEHIVTAVSMLYQSAVVGAKWPLRGAITFGELDYKPYDVAHPTRLISQSMLYGKAVVEAYQVEGSQEWIGCLVSQMAVDRYRITSDKDADHYLEQQLLYYDVPLKSKENRTDIFRKGYHVIRWGFSTISRQEVIKYFTKHARLSMVPEEVSLKFENTCDFIEFITGKSLE